MLGQTAPALQEFQRARQNKEADEVYLRLCIKAVAATDAPKRLQSPGGHHSSQSILRQVKEEE